MLTFIHCMKTDQFIERLDQLIKEGKELVIKSPTVAQYQPLNQNLNIYTRCHTWMLSCLNLMRSQFGQEHHFYNNFQIACGSDWTLCFDENVQQPIEYPRETVARAYAVLIYVKKEVKLGLVADAKHLYEANLFSNLLEQAFELADKDYLVGSAVYGRLIIENYINDLCRIKKIELEDRDKLPQKLSKLRKKEVINLPLERTIQAAYDIGTYAVHGKNEFEKYSKGDIMDYLSNIRDKILTIK